MLPPACDEFLFYDTLEGVDLSAPRRRKRTTSTKAERPAKTPKPVGSEPETDEEVEASGTGDLDSVAVAIAQTVAGLQRMSNGAVLASSVKRALLRKDPTFSEAEVGFRGFRELLLHLAERNVIELTEGSAKGDPEVSLPSHGGETEAFALLQGVVAELQAKGSPPVLSGLKDKVRKAEPGFSEKRFGYGGFLQFCKAAQTHGVIDLAWDADAEDYVVTATTG
jgi:hypothetical protein